MSSPLRFHSFTSAVNVSFWYELVQRKLSQYKLNDAPVKITGYYTISAQKNINSTEFYLDADSFDSSLSSSQKNVCPGILYNTNTIGSFKDLDKKELLNNIGHQIWDDILTGEAAKDPLLLTRFVLVTFADLKAYKFYYWFGFPALCFDEPIVLNHVKPIEAIYNKEQIDDLRRAVSQRGLPSFFVLKRSSNGFTVTDLQEWKSEEQECLLGFIDPSNLAENPGWPLRNLLMLVAKQWNVQQLQVVCYREHEGLEPRSIVLSVQFPEGNLRQIRESSTAPKILGWELNKGQLAPRFVNLQNTMDPVRLAAASVDLNLKLMQWRLLPTLNLTKIMQTKCLLLGAGTLGCNVARCLMSWGVRNITLVDNGRVSYSNPVRQSLFDFEDCLEGGKRKAEAAAQQLKAIFPGMNSVGIDISIPMPGHPVATEDIESVTKTVQTLKSLIETHDVIFILMDSRESRWLPTLLCTALGKLAINVALGFDTYLAMRHAGGNTKLGCYFCNDVVAPQNSLKDRTIDQQCTVTRPGLSCIASAVAVELMVSILHHPLGTLAPAETSTNISERGSTEFGVLPHSIRGFLSHFSNILVTGFPYDKCTACSELVVKEYQQKGQEFLLQAFNSPTYLEDITGLTKMKQEVVEDVQWDEFADDL